MSSSKHLEILTFIDKRGLLIGKVLLSSLPRVPFCCGLATKFHGSLQLPLMRSRSLILEESCNCVPQVTELVYRWTPEAWPLTVVPSVSLSECHDSKWTAASWVTPQLKARELLSTFEPAYAYVRCLGK